jgi:hypothetical protein
VNAFSEKPGKIVERLAERLTAGGIVGQEDGRLLWIIPYKDCLEQNASAKYWVKHRLRAQALTCEDLELRALTLLSLVKACDLLHLVFTKDEMKAVRQRIHQLMVGEALHNPVAQSIEEIDAAVEALVDQD